MPLHPTIANFLANLPAPAEGPLNPVMMRAGDESHVPPLGERVPVYAVNDRLLVTHTGDVRVRIYQPTAAANHPVIIYFHGGAFFLGSLNTHDHIARQLANASGCLVVAVDYRLAPEHAFPAGLNDCYAVTRWVSENGNNADNGIGWNGKTLALAGDSSGANFVAAVSAMALDNGLTAITHQILYYPSVDLDFDDSRYESLRSNAVGYGLETAGLKPFNSFYLDSGADAADPHVSPIKRGTFEGLPKALIVTAEYDPLRDEGELYGAKLKAAAVPVKLRRYDGAGHGFVQYFSWLPEFNTVYAETADFLKEQP